MQMLLCLAWGQVYTLCLFQLFCGHGMACNCTCSLLLPNCIQVTLFDLKVDNMKVASGLLTVYAEAMDFAKRNSLDLHMQQLTRHILDFENSWSYPRAFLDQQSSTLAFCLGLGGTVF